MSSFYQSLKIEVVEFLNLSKDAIHVHIGLFVLLASIIMIGKGKIKPICLVPVLVVASLMEALDLYDDARSIGHLRLDASFHDLLNTCFWPTLICGIALLRGKDNKNGI